MSSDQWQQVLGYASLVDTYRRAIRQEGNLVEVDRVRAGEKKEQVLAQILFPFRLVAHVLAEKANHATGRQESPRSKQLEQHLLS